MNVDRLREIARFLREQESTIGIQGRLQELNDVLQNLVREPNNPSHQTEVVKKYERYDSGLRAFYNLTTPGQWKLIEEIGGTEYFDLSTTDKIKEALSRNAVTPAIVREQVTDVVNRRSTYLIHLESLENAFAGLGIKSEAPPVGTAELAFSIPRDLFENNLGGLSKELAVINHIVRDFTEVIVGHTEPVVVHQISSSDPTVLLVAAIPVALGIAKVVNGFLDAWKKVEEIKEVRGRAQRIGITEASLQEFNQKITASMSAVIEKQTKGLMEQSTLEDARRNEMSNAIQMDIERLYARIERGLTIEIRIIEAPVAHDESGAIATDSKTIQISELRVLSQQMIFPVMHGEPVLKLPPPPEDPLEPPGDEKDTGSSTAKAAPIGFGSAE